MSTRFSTRRSRDSFNYSQTIVLSLVSGILVRVIVIAFVLFDRAPESLSSSTPAVMPRI